MFFIIMSVGQKKILSLHEASTPQTLLQISCSDALSLIYFSNFLQKNSFFKEESDKI